MNVKLANQESLIKTTQCPVCFSTSLQSILSLPQLPVLVNVIWDTREQAIAAPRGDVHLAFCQNCGHLFNQSFNASQMIYDVQYENSLHFSPKFQKYATSLARRLVYQYDLHGKSIVEIGSGKGDFLRLLCEFGGNVGTGFDPSYAPSADESHPAMSFIQDEYSPRYSGYQADFICSRHTLEHLANPGRFVQDLRQTIADRKRTIVFVEVPNLRYILRYTAIWDIIYEHHSYFSANSLSTLFTTNSFNVLNVAEAFEAQFLYIEVIPRDPKRSAPNTNFGQPVNEIAKQVEGFSDRSQEKISYWQEKLENLSRMGKRIVIWGAGSKGISFLNMLQASEAIPYAVDINPRKRGKFITGTGQQIVPPDFMRECQPDAIIIMNPIYRQEIQETVAQLGLQPELMVA